MTHSPDDYALVIGVNDYPNWNKGAKSLKGSVRDAQDFRDWLVDKNGGGLLCKNVKLLVSRDNPLGPRQHLIDDAFREIREQSEGKTRRRFYFYFSGHGHSRAGSWQQQSLCLANWSPVDAGAALHLESYIKASVGCLKFSEGVFFLDCCRVRAVVPLGQQSELECGDPDTRNRYTAILFGSDHYEPTFEGEVNEEVRGYFTAGLLTVLKQGTIELADLLERLRIIVPDLAKPKDQTVRAVPADTKIYLGPPVRKPPPENYAEAGRGANTSVKISVKSNLTGSNNPKDDLPAPQPGDISVLRSDLLVARGMGLVDEKLAPGHYQIRVDHAEASATYELDVGAEPVERAFELPRRSSATLLSSTIDKHEWLTDPVVAASKWDTSRRKGQAAFVSVRPRQLGDASDIVGWLYFNERSELREIHEANSLHFLEPGTVELRYYDPDRGTSILPIPIVEGWDTHIFILTVEGRAQLATASVSMRPAGAGFDPSDALIDAYERGIADLVTGGRGPDWETLDNMLWGKYRNPLFGLLGAHFLIRKLRHDPRPDPRELTRLEIVAENLGRLLGANAPDVAALRLWRQLISNEQPTERFSGDLPLFNAGFQAFVEAIASSDAAATNGLDEITLGLDANSPWTLRRSSQTNSISASWSLYPTPHSTFEVETEAIARLTVIENAWREEGFAVESMQAGGLRKLRATRTVDDGPGIFDAADRANTILRVPDSLVGYMSDAIGRSKRTGEPLDLARLVRRTMLPMSVLLAAKSLAEHVKDEATEVPDPDWGSATALAEAEAEGVSAPWRHDDVFHEEAKEGNVDNDEDDGEMSAGAA